MTAPITPDERAAMRETVATLNAAWEADDPTRPLVTEHAALALLAQVASEVPRLLDALDKAEAEVRRCRAQRNEWFLSEFGAREVAEAEVVLLRKLIRKARHQRDEVTRLHEDAETLRGWITEHEKTIIETSDVRDHLPAKPSRDEVIAALHGLTYERFMAPHVEESARVDLRTLYGRQADKVLSLLPGRSEAR